MADCTFSQFLLFLLFTRCNIYKGLMKKDFYQLVKWNSSIETWRLYHTRMHPQSLQLTTKASFIARGPMDSFIVLGLNSQRFHRSSEWYLELQLQVVNTAKKTNGRLCIPPMHASCRSSLRHPSTMDHRRACMPASLSQPPSVGIHVTVGLPVGEVQWLLCGSPSRPRRRPRIFSTARSER